MLLFAYLLISIILALPGAAVWRFNLTGWLNKRSNLAVSNPNKLARNAGLFLNSLGVYAVICGHFAEQATTKNS